MALKYGQTSDTIVTDSTYSFRLGHVERVFTQKNDIKIFTDFSTDSQLIQFTSVKGNTSQKAKQVALPLLRGVNDSITRGDVILYVNIGGKNFYLGPINTKNLPSNSSDHTYDPKKGKKVFNEDLRKDRSDGYNKNIPNIKIPKLSKIRHNTMDFPGQLDSINPTTIEYAESTFSDLTLEGRYGNAIRVGARNQFPQLIISNNNTGDMETLSGGGSVFAMTSIGTISNNFPIEPAFQLSSDIKILEANEQSDDILYKGFVLGFNYDYGQIKPLDVDEEQSEFDQVIISSDRIIFNSTQEDITLSSNRGIKIGAAENIEMTNKGYSVFESRNIYIGKKARDRSQPMVLGEELRRLLTRILRLIADAQALGDYNVPQPLTVFPNVLQAGSLRTEVDSIMKEFNLGSLIPGQNPPSPDPGYQPNVTEGEPSGDRSTGNATFMSQHHFIETNRE
tara:strand:- start:15 stop:1364 length:1350 start_codon:yes stop_codon:yes gene_type:complete